MAMSALPVRPSRSAASGLACLAAVALLAAPAALAQPQGAAGGREIAPMTGATVPGASSRGGDGTVRERVQDRLRDTDRARPPERDREQLRDLNALSRELAPGVPPPAPGAEGGATR